MPHVFSNLALPIVAAITLLAAPVSAQFRLPGTPDAKNTQKPLTAERLVKVRLVADVPAIQPGATFHLAVIFDIEPEWHIYWTDPGASGAPTEVTVRAPLGYTVGETKYPRPEIIPDPAGATNGYHDKIVLFVPVTAPPDFMPGLGRVTFDADVAWFVCRERCLIGRAKRSVTVDLETRATDEPTIVPDARIIDRFRARLPRPLTEIENGAARIESARSGTTLVITGSAPSGTAASPGAAGTAAISFLPLSTPGVTCGEPQTEMDGDRFVVRVPLDVRRQNALGEPLRVCGLLTIGEKSDQPCYHVNVDLNANEPLWDAR